MGEEPYLARVHRFCPLLCEGDVYEQVIARTTP